MTASPWAEVLAAYRLDDPAAKCAAVAALPAQIGPPPQTLALPPQPGRPARPERVHPSKVARRKLGSTAGRAALVHAVAHIEFNAINLALDAALRFRDMPAAFYADWLSVARDEARHFNMLAGRLDELGSHYGALPAHNGLWEMAEKTAHDVLYRMALVPRVLEARGLDVTPGMIQRLEAAGDAETVAHLRVILAEEERHVAIGSHWFATLCRQRGLEPGATFQGLLADYGVAFGRGAINVEARRRAGFSEAELAAAGG